MAKRQVFFSFHYTPDKWRAAQVKNMGIVDSSATWSANDWEEVRYKTDAKIKEWIDAQMAMRSCIVVLIGKETSSRKWVKYEIEKAYKLGKGFVGVYIHGLKNADGEQTTQGTNPFIALIIRMVIGFQIMLNVIIYHIPRVHTFMMILRKI